MTRYIVYRWPRDRTSEVTPTDGAFRWVAAEAEVISRLFRDDPGRRDAQLRMLQDGYVGLLCVADGGWCAYAWMRRPNRPGPPHLPRNARRPAAYWITYCRTRPSFRKRGLFQAALRQLVAVAAAENEEADVYVDADANNEMSHRGIVASGFAAVGVIDALSAAVPKVGRIVVGRAASGCDARRTRERPRAIGSVGRGDRAGASEQIGRVGVSVDRPAVDRPVRPRRARPVRRHGGVAGIDRPGLATAYARIYASGFRRLWGSAIADHLPDRCELTSLRASDTAARGRDRRGEPRRAVPPPRRDDNVSRRCRAVCRRAADNRIPPRPDTRAAAVGRIGRPGRRGHISSDERVGGPSAGIFGDRPDAAQPERRDACRATRDGWSRPERARPRGRRRDRALGRHRSAKPSALANE